MEPLNNVDVIILIGFVVSMLVAFIRGFVKEVLSILGLALFVILVVYLSPKFLPILNKYIASQILAQIVIFLVIMAVFYAIWIISTDKLINRIRTSTLSFMDRLFGLLFGLLRALLLLGFCFLILKIMLPDEIKKESFKKSKFFVVAQTTSDVIEKILPESLIKETVKSVEDMNKVEKKKNEAETSKDKTIKEEEGEKKMPSSNDQEQMNMMFEKLVKPEIKQENKPNVSQEKKGEKTSGYDRQEINNLDRLIDLTTKE